jgi:Arc/MetJ-type ribon-helix-helix transcriptional regulator
LNGEFAPRLKVAGSKTEDDVLREAIDTLEKRQRGLCELQEKVREAEADIAAGRRWPFDADETKSAVRK